MDENNPADTDYAHDTDYVDDTSVDTDDGVDTDSGKGIWQKVEGIEAHLAISNRLYAATSKAVENLPVFITLFDQWVYTPSLRPWSLSEWHETLLLIQPSISDALFCKDLGLRSVARLFLRFDSKKFRKGKQAFIEGLAKHISDTPESSL